MEFVTTMQNYSGPFKYSDATINAVRAVAEAKQGPEQDVARAEAAAKAAQSRLNGTKQSIDKLRNLGYNIGSMDENQLYDLATSLGVI